MYVKLVIFFLHWQVADYCEGNYTQAQDKKGALEETKNYT